MSHPFCRAHRATCIGAVATCRVLGIRGNRGYARGCGTDRGLLQTAAGPGGGGATRCSHCRAGAVAGDTDDAAAWPVVQCHPHHAGCAASCRWGRQWIGSRRHVLSPSTQHERRTLWFHHVAKVQAGFNSNISSSKFRVECLRENRSK